MRRTPSIHWEHLRIPMGRICTRRANLFAKGCSSLDILDSNGRIELVNCV